MHKKIEDVLVDGCMGVHVFRSVMVRSKNNEKMIFSAVYSEAENLNWTEDCSI